MKKLCLVVACVSLISCIPVDDFGSYWDKAGADPQLAGTWKRIAANPQQTREQGYSTGDVMRLVAKDGQYDLTDDSAKAKGEKPMPTRTLTAGEYQFLTIAQENKGFILRYKVTAQTLEFCDAFGPSLVAFVRSNYPHAASMKKNQGEGDYMTIAFFSEETRAILGKIPDTDEYWSCDQRYQRIP